ncbi:MAG: NADP-dependent oxidoreductase [Vagococcus sp.]|uniref:NADP-dependent oxidoreductase n=1 Tax=Vagococcus sp. TaxID=1933889 RepID=UPI002FC5C308
MVKSLTFGFDSFGNSDVLKEATIEVDLTEEKDVLIKTEHISVNPAEISMRKGLFSKKKAPTNFRILGNEIQGTVVKTNENVTNLKIGDNILAYIPNGGDSEYAAINHRKAFKVPSNMSNEVAAGFPMIATTAYWCLDDYFFKSNKMTKLTIVGASGSVGSMIVQLAKQRGITVLAAASQKNKDYLVSLGADYTLDYRNSEEVDRFKGWADYVINASLFNAGEELALSLLNKKGTYLGLNALPNLENRPDVTAFFMKKTAEMKDEDALKNLLEMYQETKFELRIGHVLPFSLGSLKEAHTLIESGKNNGKVILKR